jgi:hypothetical protein
MVIKGQPHIVHSLRSSALLLSAARQKSPLTTSFSRIRPHPAILPQRAICHLAPPLGSSGSRGSSRHMSLSSSGISSGASCTRAEESHVNSTRRVINSDLITPVQQRQSAGQQQQRELEVERAHLLAEAKCLTLILYRTIVRSVRAIRHGNEHDEVEFQAREKQRKDKITSASKDVRLSMLSMLPPVDRSDELRSRAEYYQQYARENFVQASDCLNHDVWEDEHVARYLYHLRQGEEHRKWLLADMKFADPFAHDNALDHDRVDDFGNRAKDLIKRNKHVKMQAALSPEEFNLYTDRQNVDQTDVGDDDEGNDGWSTEEDDDDIAPRGLPSWVKNPRST